MGVFDTGVGLTDHQIIAINAGEASPLSATATGTMVGTGTGTDSERDPDDLLAGTGLGLSIVRALAHARGGTLHASHAPDGGAAMTLTFPLDPRGDVGPFGPRVASDAMPLPVLPSERNATSILVVPGVAKS